MIDQSIFYNHNLSFKAKGLLCQMLSLPDGWEFSVEGLTKLSTDGRSAVTSALNELQAAGYFYRKEVRDSGKFYGVEYVISETQIAEKPIAENPISEKPISENHQQSITKESITDESITKSSSLRSEEIYKGLSENLIEALKDFEEMRKKIKSPMTDRAKVNLLAKLDKLAGDDEDYKIRLLDEAILNNWKSVYPPREQTQSPRNRSINNVFAEIFEEHKYDL